jgi:glutamate-1-semialdehyde 2,1-aminomutase
VERLQVSEIVWQRGERLQASLREIAARHPICKLQIGGMPASPSIAFALGEDTPLAKALYVRKMAERGFLASGYSYLMLAHGDAEVSQFIDALDQVMGELTTLIERECLEAEAGVPRKDAGFVRLA